MGVGRPITQLDTFPGAFGCGFRPSRFSRVEETDEERPNGLNVATAHAFSRRRICAAPTTSQNGKIATDHHHGGRGRRS